MSDVQEKKFTFAGKDITKIAQIFAFAFVQFYSNAKFISQGFDKVVIGDVLLAVCASLVCFLPIFASIITDKIKGLAK